MKGAQVWFAVVPILAAVGLHVRPIYREQGGPVRVNINVSCGGSALGMTVAPWRAEIHHGQALAWQPHGQVDSVRIATPTNWPFVQIPAIGQDTTAISGGTVPSTAKPGSYHYSINAFCHGGPKIVIDPDVVIDDN